MSELRNLTINGGARVNGDLFVDITGILKGGGSGSKVAAAVEGLDYAAATPVVSQSASVAINPNRITKLGILTGSVTLNLAIGQSGKANIYDIIFSTGSGIPTIIWPTGISWAEGSTPTIRASKSYEVCISENLATIIEFF